MLDRLQLLADYHYYFQFTLTPYGNDIEPHLPPKAEIIDTFLKLSDKTGKKRIIWRYDPILLSASINIDDHMEHFHDLARRLAGHTEKCIISFMDMYRHIRGRMADHCVRPPNESEMRKLSKQLAQIAGSYNMKMATCAEKIDLVDLGIEHGKCIDDRLISELTGTKLNIGKDKYQRELCGCVASVDIGEYNSCGHGCRYCYANVSQKKIEKNQSLHYTQSPLLIGDNSSCESQ
jgi:DNA repair photolyase